MLGDLASSLTPLAPFAAEYDPEADVLHQNAKLEDSDDELLPLAASRQGRCSHCVPHGQLTTGSETADAWQHLMQEST